MIFIPSTFIIGLVRGIAKGAWLSIVLKMSQTSFKNPLNNPLGPIVSILLIILFIMGLFYIARAAFWLLSIIAPILLIITLIIDRQVVIDYGMWLVNSVKNKNWVMFIAGALLTIFGFPLVSGFLFGKAMLRRKIKQVKEEQEVRQKGEFIEYEELDEAPMETLELPDWREKEREIPKQKSKQMQQPRGDNEYEQLFD